MNEITLPTIFPHSHNRSIPEKAVIIIPVSGPALSVEAASSRLRCQDGASTIKRTDATLAAIMIDAPEKID
jgi:hypothetical protein